MKVFEKVSMLNCTLEELFDFHLDVNNLKSITPIDTTVEVLNKDFTPFEGAILKLKTVKNFIPINWEVKILKLEKPKILVDLAIKSPFKSWEHSHIFTQKGNMCELKDVIKYELPFGKVGNFFDFFVKKELEKMFNFRHEITKIHFAKLA